MIDLGSEMQVCAEASTLARARTLLPRHQPDLVVVDTAMEDDQGFAFLKEVNSGCTRGVVFSRAMNTLSVQRAFQCGARAVISHQDSQEAVLSALLAVVEGRKHIAPCVTATLAGNFTMPGVQEINDAERLLSERELQIYYLLGRGCSVKEIAVRLSISAKTVESNEARMKEKLKLKNNSILRHAATLFVSRKDEQADFQSPASMREHFSAV